MIKIFSPDFVSYILIIIAYKSLLLKSTLTFHKAINNKKTNVDALGFG